MYAIGVFLVCLLTHFLTCTTSPQIANKHQIANEFLEHETILHRQPSIDQICCGLDSLGFLSLVKLFPDKFKSIFSYQAEKLTPLRVIAMLKFETDCVAAKLMVDVLKRATPEGMCYFNLT